MDFKDENLEKKMTALGLKWADFDEQFIRGSGKGGQKINKTSSMVLLRHARSGLEVRVQKHREQSKNRLSAYRLLVSKLEDKILGRQSFRNKKMEKLRKQKKKRAKKNKLKLADGVSSKAPF